MRHWWRALPLGIGVPVFVVGMCTGSPAWSDDQCERLRASMAQMDAQKLPEIPYREIRQCMHDNECIRVRNDICSVPCGVVLINARYEGIWDAHQRALKEPTFCAVAMVSCLRLECEAKPVCDNGICTFIKE